MLAIKSNLMAENAARHLGQSYDALSQSVERLSSGLRINSAKDDAAGMAVSELLKADVAVNQQGGRNANDGISMLQTAEGAMGVQDDLLVRMKELAVQASTDSYSPTQRGIMDQEFQQLAQEITRVAQSTTFNGISLLNSNSSYGINVGSSQTINIQASVVTAAGLGLGNSGSTESTTFNTHTANPNLPAFVTAGAAGSNEFKIKFGSETAIDVTLTAAATYSMNDLVQAINNASQISGSYNAASITYDATTGMYGLKIAAKGNGDVAVDFTGTTQASMATGNFTGTNGASGNAVNILTDTSATNALASLTSAIDAKDSYRAELGYMMNRLQSAVSVTGIQSENLQAAQSRIADVDTATETAALTRNQVLAQAGISMLAQANQMPQMALKLLG